MNRYLRTRKYLLEHKIITIIGLIVLIVIGYYSYRYFWAGSSETKYVIAAVEKGEIVSVVTGSGQVSSASEFDIKPKASGEVVYLGAKSGDRVGAGQLLVQLDARDAQIALENAQIALAKITEGAGGDSGETKDYEDSLKNIDDTFIDLPVVLEGMNQIVNNYTVSVYKTNPVNERARDYYNQALKSYWTAYRQYDKDLNSYRGLNRPIPNSVVDSLNDSTYEMVKLVTQALKDLNTFVAYTYYYYDVGTRTGDIATDKTNLDTWIATVSTLLSDLGTSHNTLKNSQLDIQAQVLAVRQKELAYQNYFVYAPFSGVIGQMTIDRFDTVSAGSSIGILASDQKEANISLNEVDVVKVKRGQKATLTFDAIDGLEIVGTVTEVDAVGTVSSGVVSYNVKIIFNTQDGRVKSGMSVSASIENEVKKDILVVPSGAIKNSARGNYVDTVSASEKISSNRGVVLSSATTSQQVKIGLSDDLNTEIISGLKEGDKVIARTIVSSATKQSAPPSIFGSSGGGSRSVTGTRSSASARNSSFPH